jgi:Ion channel
MTQASPARRAGSSGDSRPYRPPDADPRYGLLLLILILTYLLSAFNVRFVADFDFAFFAAALLLALRTSPFPRRWKTLVGAVALGGSVLFLGLGQTGGNVALGAADVWKTLILLLTVALIVRRVLARSTVTIQSIYGAVSAYIVIGLMFAAVYAAIQHFSALPFFAGGKPGQPQTFQYFSFTTLTTLGYGDFTAASDGGRAIAVMEALLGQVFLATLVARLVASFRPRAQPARNQASRRLPLRTLQDGAGLTRRRKPPGRVSSPASVTRKPAGRGPAP